MELYVNDNSIQDISPLLELPWFRYLEIKNNPLDEKSINTHIPLLIKDRVGVIF